MLFKSAFVASILAGYQAEQTLFDYQVECDYLVHAVSYTTKSEKIWSSTEQSRSTFDSLEVSMSAGVKYGLVKGNVAAAMKTVNQARTETKLSDRSEILHSEGYQPHSSQVHRRCTHKINIGGEVITQTDSLYLYTDRRDSSGNYPSITYWQEQARNYINKNIVPQFEGLTPLPVGTTRLSVIFNVDIPLQNGWEVNEWLDVVDGHWGDWGTIHICPKDHYAMSLRVRDEEYQHSGDDTALNGLQMRCRHVKGKANGRSILASAGAPFEHYGQYRTEWGHRIRNVIS